MELQADPNLENYSYSCSQGVSQQHACYLLRHLQTDTVFLQFWKRIHFQFLRVRLAWWTKTICLGENRSPLTHIHMPCGAEQGFASQGSKDTVLVNTGFRVQGLGTTCRSHQGSYPTLGLAICGSASINTTSKGPKTYSLN